jgi:hypothetical protein
VLSQVAGGRTLRSVQSDEFAEFFAGEVLLRFGFLVEAGWHEPEIEHVWRGSRVAYVSERMIVSVVLDRVDKRIVTVLRHTDTTERADLAAAAKAAGLRPPPSGARSRHAAIATLTGQAALLRTVLGLPEPAAKSGQDPERAV